MVLSPPTNTSKVSELFVWVNDNTSGNFGIALLIAIFMISFIYFKKSTTAKAFAASSFITAVLSVLLFAAGVVAYNVVMVCVVVSVIGVIAIYAEK